MTVLAPAPTDTPVVPAAVGTWRLKHNIDGLYTAGRDHVGPALLELFRRTDTVGADIETYGLGVEARRIKSVSFGDAHHAVVLDPRDPKQAEMVRFAFKRAGIIVFHNAPYDVPNLYLNDLITLDDVDKVFDTLIYARLANPNDFGGHSDLFSAAKTYLGLRGEDELLKAFKLWGYSKQDGYYNFDLDRPVYLQGAASDPIMTARLFPIIREAAYRRTTQGHPFKNHGVTGDEAWRLVDREQVINRVFLKRSCLGLPVDLDYLDQYEEKTSSKRHTMERALAKNKIDPGNGNHLIAYLERENALPEDYPRTAKTKQPSAAKGDLELLTHPMAKVFVAQKEIAKIQDDYLAKVKDLAVPDGKGGYRIHPIASPLKAATGRASMADPPFQQFPAEARGIVVAESSADADQLVSIDWSAIEPCITANWAGEEDIVRQYEEGIRLYTAVANAAGVPDKTAKVVLLAQLYGEGLKKLAADLGITIEAAKQLKEQIFDPMPSISQFIHGLRQCAREHQVIMTLSGRIVPVPSGMYDGNWSVQAHKGVNYTVQGSAYDVLAEVIVAADEAGISDKILLTMHDEIVTTKDVAHEIRKLMETPPPRLCYVAERVPVLRTDMNVMGERWMYV